MKEIITNFGVLMDILGIHPRELSVAVGADKTLISRWRSGERKLIAGRRWIKNISAYFIEVDSSQEDPILPELLNRIYPTEGFEGNALQHMLERWMAMGGQLDPEYQEKRRAMLLSHFSAGGQKDSRQTSVTVIGEDAVRLKILEFLEQVTAMSESGEVLFYCPDGLGLVTMNEQYADKLMEQLMAMFKSGKSLTVVLRSDYKISEVSSFSGPWLVAHLLGYINSWYYNDFRLIDSDKMMIEFNGKMAGVVSPYGRYGKDVKFTINYERGESENIASLCRSYLKNALQRFHYHYFQQPDDFFAECGKTTENPCFLFERLPSFGVTPADEFATIGLSPGEIEYMHNQFRPFFTSPDMFNEKVRVCHMFCSDAIDEALDQTRQRFNELTDMFGRRVIFSPQFLVDRLKHIRELLAVHKNYHVCFVNEPMFESLKMQIGVWGNEAAIGWIPSGRSTACRDYINVGALHGFCATIWERIPSSMRTRTAAVKKINVWLKRAQRYGFNV